MNLLKIALIFFFTIIYKQALPASHCSDFFSVVPFSIVAKDNTTDISGQIDLPPEGVKLKGMILLIPGSGLHDRDVDFGTTGLTEDLIFKKISDSLTLQGFGVARFDYRGIKCNKKTMPICSNCSEEQIMVHFIKHCVDTSVRRTVSSTNIRDDIESIYNLVQVYAQKTDVDLFIIGHSEASLHISYLVQQKRINPKSILFLGGMAESISSTFKWQVSQRYVDALRALDKDNDGRILNNEIIDGYKNGSIYLSWLSIEHLISEKGFLDLAEFAEEGELSFQYMMNEAIKKEDSEPFFDSDGNIVASYSWWKMFFLDNTNVLDYLSGYTGNVIYLNGDIDSQVNFDRQKNLIDSHRLISGQHNIQIIKIPSAGHALGADPLYGPMLESSLDLISFYMSSFITPIQSKHTF